MWITNGTRADFITLAVRTGDAGYGGISLVTFPTDVQGLQGHARSSTRWATTPRDTAMLYFEDCRIPARYLLGEENQRLLLHHDQLPGRAADRRRRRRGRAWSELEDAIRYGRERQAFGRPILKFQVWRHKFAELLTAIEAARWLTYRACDLFNRKQDAVKEITMAKLFAGELAQQVAYDCLQVHGGIGYIDESPIARAWRDVRLITIGGGTSEIMKEIIAKLEASVARAGRSS